MIEKEALKIIQDCATASAASGGAFALISIFSFDIPVLSALLSTMIVKISEKYDRCYPNEKIMEIIPIILPIFSGMIVGKMITGLIPLVGNMTNIGINYYLFKKLGRACVAALKNGKDLTKLSGDEWKSYIKDAK